MDVYAGTLYGWEGFVYVWGHGCVVFVGRCGVVKGCKVCVCQDCKGAWVRVGFVGRCRFFFRVVKGCEVCVRRGCEGM